MIRNTILSLLVIITVVSSCQQQPYKQGEIMYQNFCANCHMENGMGLRGQIPPLAGADYLQQNQEQLACVIRYGMEGPIVVNGQEYNQPMPGVEVLSDFEITNIINYINQAWGNEYGVVKLIEVREALESCE